MNARAEQALYAAQDCGGSGVLRARGHIAARLALGKHPRMRDIRTLELAAAMSGNTQPDISDDDWEPALYTQSQLDAAGVRIGSIVSTVWAVICGIVVYVALTGVRP